jgi:alkylated DNA repair dioxygenase AlkB
MTNQLDIFGNESSQKKEIGLVEIQNGEYQYYPKFFNTNESKIYFDDMINNILWKQESMIMYGKKIPFPRLTSWYGDDEKPYSFSGIKLNPNKWTKTLLEIKDKITIHTDAKFNSVLLNRYRNGNDSISWHTDAEKELGNNPIIASVNFGATRKFQLRHINTGEKVEIELQNGSLLIMQGSLQHYWQHQVPKTSRNISERINLTFRVIK